jgi:hypothetical protein
MPELGTGTLLCGRVFRPTGFHGFVASRQRYGQGPAGFAADLAALCELSCQQRKPFRERQRLEW